MMVAPLFAGEPEREVVFPDGQWYDFWTGNIVQGKRMKLSRSTERIPVYVKAGSVMPWAAVGPHADAAEARRWEVRVYGDGHLAWSTAPDVGALQLEWEAGAQRGQVRNNGQRNAVEITGWHHFG